MVIIRLRRRVSCDFRDAFYRYKQAVDEGGVEALIEKSRRRPNLRNRTAPEIEEAIVALAVEDPAYERGKLRPHPDVIVRLAEALRVSTDEMLGVKPAASNGAAVSRRVLRRLQAIDGLPKRDQDALFRTIDAFLQARRAS